MSSPLEDKKCRLCGYADQKNVNMFNAPNKGLVTKIRSVFPILLYEQDPMPKHICKKCIATVSFMFLDIQRVMKMQQKWISNVRCNEPNNNYICILDMIESASRGVKQSIKTILHEDISMESIKRVSLSFPIMDEPPRKKFASSPSKPLTKEMSATTVTQVNNYISPVKIKIEPKQTVSKNEHKHEEKTNQKMNGCSLIIAQEKPEQIPYQTKRAAAVAAAVACTSQLLEREPKTRKLDNWHHLKKERNKPHSSATNCTSNNNVSKSPFKAKQQLLKAATILSEGVKCPLCSLYFKTANELAAHQVLHLRLQLPKIFVRKCLPKKERRGRLLNSSDKQCIRCLNCWRIFEDNKSILSHWSQSDCAFYCQICGKEFAHAPKMLREHVPAAHGVSYRSAKHQHAKHAPPVIESNIQKMECNTDFLTTLNSKEYKQEELRIKKVKKTNPLKHAACGICELWFHNMKARNSHMRKHKKKEIIEAQKLLKEETVTPKREIYHSSEDNIHNNVQKTNDIATTIHTELPVTNIKTEPLEIEEEKCHVCHNVLTGGLEQHACF